LPMDKLFWCMGSHGSVYPLTGQVFDEKSPIHAAVLLSERMNFKLHRELMIQDSSPDDGGGFNGAICSQHLRPILPKSRYRYQMVANVPVANKCYQFGRDVSSWEVAKNNPGTGNCFGFLIWKKRNCSFL
jgi:TraU protein.